MTLENGQASTCDIRFGVSGLRHPSLQDNFYPSDLPEDWRLDYYSNEFRLILLNPADFGLIAPLNFMSENITAENTVSEEMLADIITELCDDIDDEDFVVFLDVSELSEALLKKIVNSRCNKGSSLFLIDLNTLSKTKYMAFSMPFSWKKYQGETGNCLFYYISEQQTIAPPELKSLIEQIREQAKVAQVDSVNVVFTAPDNALENCRNANLLESMM